MKKHGLMLFLGMTLFAAACNKDDNDDMPAPAQLETKTVNFLVPSSPVATMKLFSFKNGAGVSSADSASNKWDFAMRFEKIFVNSHASGPGNAAVQILDQPFDDVKLAPESGYAYDTTATQLAVKGSDWYVYNSANHTFAPKAGKTFVFRTADEKYTKMEILKALPVDADGNEVTPPTFPAQIKYELRYTYQPDGSRNFVANP